MAALYLHNNLIENIENESFKNNLALNRVELHDNLLRTLPGCMFDPLNHPSHIRHFRISGNNLSCNETLCWLRYAEQNWITLYQPDQIVCGEGALKDWTWDAISLQDLNCNTTGQAYSYKESRATLAYSLCQKKRTFNTDFFCGPLG